MFRVAIGEWSLECQAEGLPSFYDSYRERATLADEFDLDRTGRAACFVSVRRADDWPFLTVAQHYDPTPDAAFFPGALIVPETRILFLGAGTRLLAYDLVGPKRLWEDTADAGFWGWQRHEGAVVMSAEIEMAAWDLRGQKLWSTYVEPPWTYSVDGGMVKLDVMGSISAFDLRTGPRRMGRESG